jgi:5'-3' exonuclease
MKKITTAIIDFCKCYDRNKKIYFSSASTPGEGEHKLLQHIKKANNNYKYVVYGLDADLIFLSLTIDSNSIFLLRESQELKSNNSSKLSYICIDTLKQCIVNEVKTNLYDEFIERKFENDRIIKDFIFICYFLGNDFLPHIPSIDISCFDKSNINGLDLLVQAYCNTYDNLESYLVCVDEDVSYNLEFMQMFLEYLALFEEDFFSKLFQSKKYYKKLQSSDSYENEKFKIENLNFKIENDINLGMDENSSYKFRYYKKYYNADVNQNETVKQACYKYIEGLIWVAKYYFNDCSSWEWYYPFDHAPFISDLADSFKRFNINGINFKLGKPLNQLEQLLCILPPQSSYLIPKDKKWLMNSVKSPLIHLYPIKFDIDLLYKDKYWQGIPILPNLELNLVKEVCKNFNNNINEKVLVFNEKKKYDVII